MSWRQIRGKLEVGGTPFAPVPVVTTRIEESSSSVRAQKEPCPLGERSFATEGVIYIYIYTFKGTPKMVVCPFCQRQRYVVLSAWSHTAAQELVQEHACELASVQESLGWNKVSTLFAAPVISRAHARSMALLSGVFEQHRQMGAHNDQLDSISKANRALCKILFSLISCTYPREGA